MNPVRRVRAASAATLVAVLGVTLAGCGGDPEPQFAPPPSSSPSAATGSPTASATPEPWEEKSDDGAVAFVEHWLDLFRLAENSGETDDLLLASSRQCETCQAFAGEIERVYGAGGEIQSDGWKVRSFGRPAELADGFSIPLEVQQTPQRVQEEAGAAVETNAGINLGLAASLRWEGGRWVMHRLDLVQ